MVPGLAPPQLRNVGICPGASRRPSLASLSHAVCRTRQGGDRMAESAAVSHDLYLGRIWGLSVLLATERPRGCHRLLTGGGWDPAMTWLVTPCLPGGSPENFGFAI